MNEVSNKQKDSVLKSLAIAGFIGIIILLAWLAIQFVNLVPSAFSSLASLAEGIGQYQQSALEGDDPVDLTVTSNATLINAGGEALISWDTADMPGSYTFSYECVDGVAVDILDVDGLRSIACDTNYNIGDTDSLSISIDSEKARYEDIRYTVAFLGTNDTSPRAEGTALITVMNSQIADSSTPPADDPTGLASTDNETDPTTPEESDEQPVPATTTPDEVTTEPQTTPTPQFEQEYVYAIPTSDPNGRTDLAVRFLAVGVISNDSFFPRELTTEDTGAIQFEVKNYGTKTSEDWTFSVSLPNDTTYESDAMEPLKPNERAILSIGFADTTDDSHRFEVTVDTIGDQNALNDRFVEAVTFSR